MQKSINTLAIYCNFCLPETTFEKQLYPDFLKEEYKNNPDF